jgi:ferric-dicitrate binding protein FerR (iron transport regulator)
VTLSLSQLAARRLRRDVSVEQGHAEYSERRARLVRAATAARRFGRRRWAGLLLALCAGVGAGWYAISLERATSFTAGGVSGRIGAFYAAPSEAALSLVFGDGSQLRLAPGSQARVLRSEASRRALALELGSARAELRQRGGSSWELSAGPFLIEASQADLELSWDVALQTLDIRLRAGSVQVRGPGLAGWRRLRTSDQLSVKVPAGP